MAAPQSVPDAPASAQEVRGDGSGCVASGRHRLRVTGYLHGRGRRGLASPSPVRRLSSLDCDNPLIAQCQDCDYATVWACSGHRESRCKPCALRYRRRLRRVAESGMSDRDGRGVMGMLTLTAPGLPGHRQWDVTGPRSHRPECSCGTSDLGLWNATHSARWNHFRTLLSRQYPDLEYLRGVEVQDGKRGGGGRGALHDHAIVWLSEQLDVGLVQEFALRAGFGCVVHWAPVEPGSRKAAYYVSKYVTKACDSREQVPWVEIDVATGELLSDRPTYRTWSMSSDWGLTMREVRAICAAHAARTAAVRLDGTLSLLRSVLGAEPMDLGQPPPGSL